MSVADKLQTIQNIKENIKIAINNKGGNVGDDFTQYSAAIDGLSTGGGTQNLVIDNNNGIKLCYSKFTEIPDYITFSPDITDMSIMFAYCSNLTTIPLIDTSNVINMNECFRACNSLQTIPMLDTSNVTTMESCFQNCYKLTTIPMLDTSNVTNMNFMFYMSDKLISLPTLNAAKVTKITYYFSNYSLENLTDVGGWIGLKINWNDNNGLVKCPNLTYQSCINILNGLADVTELGSRTLKVHQNFIDAVGDEISIGTSKNWVITA